MSCTAASSVVRPSLYCAASCSVWQAQQHTRSMAQRARSLLTLTLQWCFLGHSRQLTRLVQVWCQARALENRAEPIPRAHPQVTHLVCGVGAAPLQVLQALHCHRQPHDRQAAHHVQVALGVLGLGVQQLACVEAASTRLGMLPHEPGCIACHVSVHHMLTMSCCAACTARVRVFPARWPNCTQQACSA